eukprot:CAMPEP_0202703036 /NCGR_PEP_ID=MMETSP1385-20130828/15931_1 /ASSEMBLY_ACC=CAM_ASM_000861 /TAXON_ID=933848 /ORGANISM="Elphidium margaritaceum" /LENGTH=48 /DNA_ID= /DNA_START= /DNA_END= /DNA_ORIENTATION=
MEDVDQHLFRGLNGLRLQLFLIQRRSAKLAEHDREFVLEIVHLIWVIP